MKLKQEFIKRKVLDDTLLIPVLNDSSDYKGIITLNESAEYIFDCIMNGMEKDDIVKSMLDVYDVSKETVQKNVDEMCDNLVKIGVLKL